MSETKENDRDRGMDKNLQDDWVPNLQRKAGATSAELTEYGGDLKRKDTIKSVNEKINSSSEKDSSDWKKKNA